MKIHDLSICLVSLQASKRTSQSGFGLWASNGMNHHNLTVVIHILIIMMSVSDITEYSKTSQRTISIWEILVILLQQHKRVIYPIHTTFQLTFIHIPGKPLQDSAWRCDIKERNRTAHNFAKHGVMEAR
jgi:hypothetical protein